MCEHWLSNIGYENMLREKVTWLLEPEIRCIDVSALFLGLI